MEKGHQFSHSNIYSRKLSANHKKQGAAWTVKDIASEARRDPEHCGHVKDPQQPEVLRGSIETLEADLDAYLAENKLPTKSGVEREARSDAHVLIADVYSWPEPVTKYNKERFDEFAQECIKFHEREFGSCDVALTHLDEAFPHMHAYTFSNSAKDAHPGHKAKKQARAEGKSPAEANKAYKAAMEAFQDRFYEQVGQKFGLERFGPRRSRKPRDEWLRERDERMNNADTLRRQQEQLEEMEAKQNEISREADEKQQILARAQEGVKKATEAAKKAVSVARQARESHEKTKKQHAQVSEQLQKRVTLLKRIEARLEKLGGAWGQMKGMLGIKSKRERELEKELKQRDQELRDTRKSITKMKARDKELSKELRWAKGDLHKLQNSSQEAREKQQKIIEDLERKKDELHTKWRMAESKVERMKQPQAKPRQGPSNNR